MPLEFYILIGTLIGASIGFIGASLMAANKRRGLYNRGWNAGRDHALRTASLQTRQSS